MLHLAFETPAEWGPWAAESIDEILLDHAHCEKKAAGTAVNLLFRYPEHPELMQPLSELAREELVHFEEVLQVLKQRGVPFGRQRPSPYAGRLMTAVRAKEPERLLDTLLCCALIEARSCERMKLLAQHLGEPSLVRLYRGLLAAEARHHRMYLDLAERIFVSEVVELRLSELAEHEGQVVCSAPSEPRLHNG